MLLHTTSISDEIPVSKGVMLNTEAIFIWAKFTFLRIYYAQITRLSTTEDGISLSSKSCDLTSRKYTLLYIF